ncbi:MAG: thioredoxin domain-containing protein [Flavobacteriaceae bacterium]
MNELHKETSPYLLQHKNNPIFWKSWNDTSLEQSRKENKLLIISIGYSACHWCHVMEHESFEDSEVAELMNRYFVSIKVDREERPDVDSVYMKAVQLMTKQGGWPLNVVALPDGRPVWGGTYFRKEQWLSTLEQLAQMWQEEPQKMLDYAQNLETALESLTQIIEQPLQENIQEVLDNFIEKWSKSFDLEMGGYARAPKFMMPTNYRFLMRYAYQNNHKPLLDYVNLTLTKMAYGGIFDVIDGGFSRYSVDMKWHIPHFEKMLYDNGQLVSLYSDAYKLTKNPIYGEIVKKTLNFVEREWLTDEGGFYAAFDAESLNENGKKEEGAFYVWKKEELQIIFKEDFELFSALFSIDDFGYWEHQNYVLIQQKPLEITANDFGISASKLRGKKESFEKTLFEIRKKRPKPALDDKIITSWNAIMNRGYTDAYKAFGEVKYLEIAQKNIEFIKTKLWSEDGNLYRTYKNKIAKINGFLEDYAFVVDALIGLYEVTANENYLLEAKQLTDYTLDNFYDSDKGLFRFKSVEDASLVSENYETEDNVIDSSNSVMARNLYTLSVYFGLVHYEDICRKMLRIVISNIDYPSAFSNWLNVWMNFDTQQKELAICGKNALENLNVINQNYFPNLIVSASEKPSNLPFLKGRYAENILHFFVCQNKVCDLPLQSIDKVLLQLKY